jgi:hypothetical protein
MHRNRRTGGFLYYRSGVNAGKDVKMDIRSILAANSVAEESIEAIEKAVKKTVGENFVDKKRYDAKIKELSEKDIEIQTVRDEVTASEKWKEKYESKEAEIKALTDKYAAEKHTALLEGQLTELLTGKMLPDSIPLAVALADKSAVKFKDGKIENADAVIEAIKGLSTLGKHFITDTYNQGVNPARPPSGSTFVPKTFMELMKEANEYPERMDVILPQVDALALNAQTKKE